MDIGLYYRKNVMSDKWLKYPAKESRKDIIMASHNLGHYGVSPMMCYEGICKTNLKLEKTYNYLEHKQFEVTNCLIEE
jgi:hypothetical protein